MNNPYSAPTATLSGASADDNTYEPSMFSLHGRIGRLRYLAYSFLASLLLIVVLGIIAGIIGGISAAVSENSAGISAILMVAINIPMFGVAFIMAIRRLNDLDRSGWLSLLLLVPFLNLLFILYLMFGGGSSQENRFGPPPSKNSTLLIIGGLLLPIIAIIGILAAVAIPAYQDYVVRAKNAQTQQVRP